MVGNIIIWKKISFSSNYVLEISYQRLFGHNKCQSWKVLHKFKMHLHQKSFFLSLKVKKKFYHKKTEHKKNCAFLHHLNSFRFLFVLFKCEFDQKKLLFMRQKMSVFLCVD